MKQTQRLNRNTLILAPGRSALDLVKQSGQAKGEPFRSLALRPASPSPFALQGYAWLILTSDSSY